MGADAYKEGAEYKTIYKCPACSEEHETKGEAKNCCPIEKAFLCDGCSEEFSTPSLAKPCCTIWVCEYCGSDFPEKKGATNCCKDEGE